MKEKPARSHGTERARVTTCKDLSCKQQRSCKPPGTEVTWFHDRNMCQLIFSLCFFKQGFGIISEAGKGNFKKKTGLNQGLLGGKAAVREDAETWELEVACMHHRASCIAGGHVERWSARWHVLQGRTGWRKDISGGRREGPEDCCCSVLRVSRFTSAMTMK